MTTPIIWTETGQKRACDICGALIGDIGLHADWHASAPVVPDDAWQKAIAKFAEVSTDWTGHLAASVNLMMFALQRIDAEDFGTWKTHLVHAAARIHAMAPEGTEWGEPWPVSPGQERSVIRAALRSMIKADNCHEHAHENATQALISAEAYLHGLWAERAED
jgi:hypothetical protein